jgi:two-component system, NtrC family, sensor histidine kinase KinB
MRKQLRLKILFGYGMVLVLMLLVLAWAFFNLRNLGKAGNAILHENYKSIIAADNMIGSIERQDSGVLLILNGYNTQGDSLFSWNEIEFLKWLTRAEDNITVKGEKEIINNLNQSYADYLKQVKEFRLLGRQPQSASFYHEKILPSFEIVRRHCAALRQLNQETMYHASDRAKYVAERAMISTLCIGLGAVLFGLGFSLFLSKLLVKPLGQMLEATRQISNGRYDIEIETHLNDELGQLAGQFNIMAIKLKEFHELNIGEIVKAKLRNEAIIKSIDDGLVVVDAEYRIIAINPKAAQIFDLVGDLQVENRHFLEIIKNEQIFNYLREAIQTGQSIRIEEGKNVLTIEKNETPRHYLFSITPVRSQSGSVFGLVLLLQDITKLKELDRIKSDFIMAASHELRTPLTSMEMSVELLQEQAILNLNDKGQQLLSILREELQRLKALVSDLLDLSKMEAGKMAMEIKPVSLNSVAERVLLIMQNQAMEKGVHLEMEFPDHLEECLADIDKITWVLINLVTNAMRYTESGGHIKITAGSTGFHIQVAVSDDGIGIPSEAQSKIFDKFVQVKTVRESNGSGLGLAICKEIIRAHGGTIWVDSTVGKGSTFYFTLPAAAKTEQGDS